VRYRGHIVEIGLLRRRPKYGSNVARIRNDVSEQSGPSNFQVLVYGAITVITGFVFLITFVGSRTREPGIPRTASEVRNLQAAIMQYKAEYGYFPVVESTVQQCRNSDSDFTFGIPSPSRLSHVAPGNSELINLLMAREEGPRRELLNSRKIKFLDLMKAQSTNDSGLGPDGVYRDPWGNPYIITLDLNGDGFCEDAFYSRPAVSSKTVSEPGSPKFESAGGNPDSFRLKMETMIWSMGPDGKADPSIPASEGVNQDNIVSWE